jgi:signal transduction histidine kinase
VYIAKSNLNFFQTKFTKSGAITLKTQLKPASYLSEKVSTHFPHLASITNNASHFIVFKVKDTGIGLHSSVISQLFQPFVQTSRDDRGTGLGLSNF